MSTKGSSRLILNRVRFGIDLKYRNYILLVPTIMVCLDDFFSISFQWLWFTLYMDITGGRYGA